MGRASPALASFNAGELSPRLAGRTDTEKYGAGCKTLENFLPLIQGPATRRGGFKMVAEVKDSTARTWLVRFEFSTTEAYVLEFGHLYVRFYFEHGQVTSGGPAYELASTYSAADLVAADGTFALRIVQSADVLYICHPNYQTRKLTRSGPTSWAFSVLTTTGGPFQDSNTTATTVYSSGLTGAVTITASAPIFTASMVGSIFRLEEATSSSQVPWQSASVVGAGAHRRHDGKNYTTVAGGTTGTDPPVHTVGTVNDGGVDWTFEDRGDGYVTITGFTTALEVTGDVVRQIPGLAVGAGNATTRWSFGAWSADEGWPTHVAFFRERLVFGRGINVWLSVSGDFENFDRLDASGLVVADSAIVRTLTSSQVNSMLWMEVFSPTSEALMIGTAGAEFAIRSQTESQPFGPDNISAQPVSTIGSRNVVPVRVGSAILFVQRSGKKLQDLTYDFYNGANSGSNDQTLYADHMLVNQVNRLAYQQEPFSIIWAQRADNKLVAMTYSREQYPAAPHGGWHRHPVTDCDVEDIVTIPTDSRNELWAILRITVGGVDRRFVCYQTPDFGLEDDPESGFFVDCGSTYDGSVARTLQPGAGATVAATTGVTFTAGGAAFVIGDVGRYIHQRYTVEAEDESGITYTRYVTAKALITGYTSATVVTATITAAFPDLTLIASGDWRLTATTITGLGYLEGHTLDVLVDGATHPQCTVSGGSITLQTAGGLVHVGKPMPARLQTMRLNAGAQDGTSQGKKGRIPSVVIRLLQTLGLKVGSTFASMDRMEFRTPSDLMDNAPPLFTGDVEQTFPGDWNTNPWLCFEQEDPLPATIVGVYPQVLTSDKG